MFSDFFARDDFLVVILRFTISSFFYVFAVFHVFRVISSGFHRFDQICKFDLRL